MVVTLHVSAGLFMKGGAGWWPGNCYDSLVRSCVPLFLMISGATLLPRQESLQLFFRKRITRIIPPLLFWSMFYLAVDAWSGKHTGNWIVAMLTGPTKYHLWYFYELIGLYMIVPVLRKFFNDSTRTDQRWFLAVWFVLTALLPLTKNILKLHFPWAVLFDKSLSNFNFTIFQGFAGYLVLGAYASGTRLRAPAGWALFGCGVTCTMVGSYLASVWVGHPSELFFDYLSPFVVMAAYGLFAVFMNMRQGPPSELVSTVGACTLGIYGLHVFIIDPVFESLEFSPWNGEPWTAVPLVSACVFLVSLLVVYLLRLFRPLRYVI